MRVTAAIVGGQSAAERAGTAIASKWRPLMLSLTYVIGLATVPNSCDPVPDAEHDDWTWWPADTSDWPDEADDRLKLMADLLGS